MKNTFRNIFQTVGIGTLIFTPILIFDNGFDESMKSVVIWLVATILYGLSFNIFDIKKVKPFLRLPLHFLVCFALTLGVRFGYSYFKNDSVEFKKLLIITSPIFVVIYVLLFLYMKNFGNISLKSESKEE